LIFHADYDCRADYLAADATIFTISPLPSGAGALRRAPQR